MTFFHKCVLILLFLIPQVSFADTLISAGALPSANSFDITNIPANYDYLQLNLNKVSSTVDTRRILVLVSYDNGVTFKSTGYFGVRGGEATIGNTGCFVTPQQALTSSTTANILLFGYNGGYANCLFSLSDGASVISGGNIAYQTQGQVNALRITWDGSGNFDSGSYALLGGGSGTSTPIGVIEYPLATSTPDQTQINLWFALWSFLAIMFFMISLFKSSKS